MLYHYFGSKEGLFIAVLERMTRRCGARQRDFAIRGSDPVNAMRRLVATRSRRAGASRGDRAPQQREPAQGPPRTALEAHPRALRSAGGHDREVLRRAAAQGIFRADNRSGDALSLALVARLSLHSTSTR